MYAGVSPIGRYNTMLRCTRCMNSSFPTLYSKYPLCNEGEKCAEYIKWGNRLISGNMYCVHRVNAAALAQVLCMCVCMHVCMCVCST